MSCDDGDSVPSRGLRAGTIRSKYGLRSSRAGARHHDGGDTLVTVSLAGSLFFSVSPTEAKTRVLLYLLLTIAPFAVVSPLLGPLIDKSANGRRILVAMSRVRAPCCVG